MGTERVGKDKPHQLWSSAAVPADRQQMFPPAFTCANAGGYLL